MFQAVRLRPGVNTTETAALNEAGISSCNLIRFFADPVFGGLPQKLGGWDRYFPNQISNVPRALWAWLDTEAVSYLAVGTQNGTNYQSQLLALSNGVQTDVTPRSITDNVTPTASTTIGSSYVTLTDATTQNITHYDTVYIPTHLSIGGLVLFGLYACDPDGSSGVSTYTVQATDKLGRPLAATGTSTTEQVAAFTTTSGASTVSVNIPTHGYVPGDTYPVLVSTTVGGVTLYGDFVIQSVTDANNFIINGLDQATSTTTASINGGKVRFIYSIGIGAVPAGTGFGVGGFGTGGFGSGPGIIPTTGTPINAIDWTLDNFGEALIACPISDDVTLTTTGTSGTGATGTITFSQAYTVPVGTQVVVSGVSPSGWNGTRTVTASASGSLSFATALTSAQTVAGTIAVQITPFQPVYAWGPRSGSPIATILTNAPQVNDGIFMAMPQRQIIAWGSTFTGIQDPLLVRWCDLNNFNQWIGQPTNQAGSYRLTRGSRIVGGMQGSTQAILWTDLDVWTMQYIGLPGVYAFNLVGQNCGLIGRKAAGPINGVPYWMGPSQFYRLGAGVEVVECTVWDSVFQNLDTTYPDRIRFAVNSRFNEVAWYYPSLDGGGEVDSYVKYNVLLNIWDYGTLGRSAWIDQSVLGPPIGTDPVSRYIYQHETSPDADGQAMNAWFQTGYWAIAQTDQQTFIDQVRPDFKFGYYGQAMNATLSFTFYSTDFPGQTPITHGPYSITQASTYFTSRMRGNLIAMKVESNDVGSWWRGGNIRYRAAADGRF